MAHVKTARMVMQFADIAYRADRVRKDPPVVKAATRARGDWVKAVRSTGELVHEAHASWARSGDAGEPPAVGVPVGV